MPIHLEDQVTEELKKTDEERLLRMGNQDNRGLLRKPSSNNSKER